MVGNIYMHIETMCAASKYTQQLDTNTNYISQDIHVCVCMYRIIYKTIIPMSWLLADFDA